MTDSEHVRPLIGDEKQLSLLKRLSLLLRGDPSAVQMRESLEEVIEESERQSVALTARERTMLANLLKFGGLKVSDVMVPRADIVAVEEMTPLDGLVAIFRDAQHSRLPVYRESLDDPIGLVHIKDVLPLVEEKGGGGPPWRDVPIPKIKRDLLFVPPSMPVVDLLLKMQTARTHLALVIDEYGGTDGLVSIEDLIEEIVGEIADEHDVDEPHVRRAEGGVYVADARVGLEEFTRETGITLTSEDNPEDVDTLGGLVVSVAGRVPLRGEIIALPSGYEFEVLDADPRRVRRVRIRPPIHPPAKADETVE
jgi:CBS domain containing-hemolysin-like protein